MTQVQVDPEMLVEAANRLDAYRQRLVDMETSSDVGDLGDGRLDACAQRTDIRIVRRLDSATAAVADMARVLREAGQTYRGSDDEVRACAASTVTPTRGDAR